MIYVLAGSMGTLFFIGLIFVTYKVGQRSVEKAIKQQDVVLTDDEKEEQKKLKRMNEGMVNILNYDVGVAMGEVDK